MYIILKIILILIPIKNQYVISVIFPFIISYQISCLFKQTRNQIKQ